MERHRNNAESTITASINNSSDPVTVSVADAAEFPSNGNFRILIDSEILLVTSVSGSDFTASRAQEGTSIASHSNGATVRLIFTSGAFDQAINDRFAVAAGDDYNDTSNNNYRCLQCNDSPHYVHNRATSPWSAYSPLYEFDPTGWTWFNQGSASITKNNPFSSQMSMPSASGNIRGLITTFTGGNNIDCWVHPATYTGTSGTAFAIGITLANSTDDKKFAFWARWRNLSGWPVFDIIREYYTNNTTFSNGSTAQFILPMPILLRLDDNGSGTATLSWSIDGLNFIQHESYNYSGNFTANRCGIISFNNGGTTLSAHYWNFRQY